MGAFSFTVIIAILSSLIAITQFQLQIAVVLILLGVGSWKMTQLLIPKVSQFMLKKRIFGLDINKKGSKGG